MYVVGVYMRTQINVYIHIRGRKRIKGDWGEERRGAFYISLFTYYSFYLLKKILPLLYFPCNNDAKMFAQMHSFFFFRTKDLKMVHFMLWLQGGGIRALGQKKDPIHFEKELKFKIKFKVFFLFFIIFFWHFIYLSV